MKRYLSFFIAGALFAAGLVISGMTQPSKVIGFLDFGGDWDPSLAFVMGGAVLVHSLAYRLVSGRNSPLWAQSFQIPTRRDIDAPLLIGAVLFGVGWGLAGYCPGPAVASAVAGEPATLTFAASLTLTMILYSSVTGRGSGTANRESKDRELGKPHVVVTERNPNSSDSR